MRKVFCAESSSFLSPSSQRAMHLSPSSLQRVSSGSCASAHHASQHALASPPPSRTSSSFTICTPQRTVTVPYLTLHMYNLHNTTTAVSYHITTVCYNIAMVFYNIIMVCYKRTTVCYMLHHNNGVLQDNNSILHHDISMLQPKSDVLQKNNGVL